MQGHRERFQLCLRPPPRAINVREALLCVSRLYRDLECRSSHVTGWGSHFISEEPYISFENATLRPGRVGSVFLGERTDGAAAG